jgi:hypothetical protein
MKVEEFYFSTLEFLGNFVKINRETNVCKNKGPL